MRSTLRLALALGAAGALRAQPAPSAPAPSTSVPSTAAPSPAAGAPRLVSGRVVVMSRDTLEPVPDTWVTLHRVGDDRAGPLDSVRTDASGRYTMRYHPFGAEDAIYFASTRFGGVAYFTRPLRGERVSGDDAELQVFDTTTSAVPTTVRGRHVIVGQPDARGSRTIIEVYEITNDSVVTRLERDAAGATGTWSVPVPPGATRFAVQQGEVPEDALVLAGSRAVLHMPLAPGLKQIAFSYAVGADAFPLVLPSERPTSVLEVLVEDPRGTVTGPRLAPVDPVTVEGRNFKRFLGSDVPAGARVTIDLPAATPAWTRWVLPALLVTIGVAMVGALAWPRRRRIAAVRATPAPTVTGSRIGEPAAELARRIAALDDAFARTALATPDARERYEHERAELKAQLASVLAADSIAR